jgi:hypothetical protein
MASRARRIIKMSLAGVLAAAGLLWAGDYWILARKAARDGDAFGQIEVHRRYAVHLRNKRTEQDFAKPAMEECVKSLFPHYDESPCWYLARHATDSQELDGSPWHFWAQ